MNPDYWDDREFYDKRREQIYKDKMAGMSNVEMVKKYEISPQRIRQIVNKINKAKRFKEV